MKIRTSDSFPIMITLFWAFISMDELLCGYSTARYVRLVFLLAIMGAIIWTFFRKKPQINSLSKSWALTLIPTSYAILMSLNITNIEYWVVYLFCVLLLFVDLKYEDSIHWIFRIIEIVGLFHAFGIVLEKISPSFFASYIYVRYPAEMYYRLTRAYYMTGFQREVAFVSAYIIAALGACIYYNKKSRLNTLKIVFLLAALILTNKRAFTVFPAMAIIIEFAIMHRYRITRKAAIGITGGSIAAVALCVLFWDKIAQIGIVQRLISTFEAASAGEDALTGRGAIWAASLQLFVTSPVIGIGWRKTEDLIKVILHGSVSLSSHNIYIQLLTETGIIGFAFYFVAFIRTIKCSVRNNRSLDQGIEDNDQKIGRVVRYAGYYQVFYLLYGLTGANFVDRPFFIMFLISIFLSIQMKKAIDKGLSLRNDQSRS